MEIQIIEPDEQGWEVVVRNGTIYEKKTIIHGSSTISVYDPIPFEIKDNPYKSKRDLRK